MKSNPILRYALLALGATLPLALLGLASYRFAAARMLEADDAANMDRARLTAKIVESELSAHLLSAAGQAADPALVEPAARRDAAAVRRRLAAQRASVPVVGRVFVVDPSGVLWADDPRADESLGRSFAYRDWFKEALASEGATLSASFVRHARPQVPVVVMAAPVRSDGRLIGLLAHQYTLEALAAHLGQRAFGRQGRILIVDSDGKPLGPVDAQEAAVLPSAPPV
ncbi:MAG: cache domain-containing protein, partial [Elusimicrobia bacterium]|nr:cache domain-containing protein [Elusimicrobiota bacterium]